MRSTLTKLLLNLWFVVGGGLTMFVGVLTPRTALWAMRVTSGTALHILRIFGGVHYEVIGNVPTSGIIASKHMSAMETGILLRLMPTAMFIIKRELAMVPIYGWTFYRAGMIAVDRRRGATNLTTLASRAAAEITKGRPLIIFPEGTRTKPGEIRPLKRGILKIAEASRSPITPVSLDTGLFYPKHGRIVPGTAKIIFGTPLPYNTSLETLTTAINNI
ncbi:MAG: 1-acyl-sn-glycerol-3-phosphate acyltransferase [Rickettsiales bacterium]|jgi:1-acyl-sn-glycerol-3-phosphate acyltransferase|nr:1-acyl-sn-glycerol-3-phosphate acyltransferase [Rickettsiales bacterium]